jgi:hypothetical protein
MIERLDYLVSIKEAETDHVEAQKVTIGTACRYRPAEVAVAGAAYLGEPINFITAELLARHLCKELSTI